MVGVDEAGRILCRSAVVAVICLDAEADDILAADSKLSEAQREEIKT